MQVATPQVDTEIAETLQWIRQTMESGTDFLTDQAPMYAEELLRYGMVSSWLGIAVSLLAIVFLIAGIVVCFRRLNEDDMDFVGVFGGMMLAVLVVLSVGYLASAAVTIIKIKTAPRVYILDHINR